MGDLTEHEGSFSPDTETDRARDEGDQKLDARRRDRSRPFLGSGCTLMGAQKVGRRCFGTELEPRYVDGIVHRWQSSTGLEAKLDGTKKSFEQIMRERSE